MDVTIPKSLEALVCRKVDEDYYSTEELHRTSARPISSCHCWAPRMLFLL